MKTAVNKYVIIMVLLFGVLIATELSKKPPLDWSETYAAEDKIPFGCNIVFEQLKELNPNALISVQDKTPYTYLDEAETIAKGLSSLVIIQSAGTIDDYEWEKLKDYALRGNTVFIASEYFNNTALDSLGLEADDYIKTFETDTVLKGTLVNPSIASNTFNYPFKDNFTYFNIKKNNRVTVLGFLHDSLPNFIKYTLGKGHIYLHSNPKVFSNIYTLSAQNYKYTFSALSYLPQQAILWDEHYKIAAQNNENMATGTPLKYILSQPALRWSYYILLLGIGLFFIFRAKRRQKAIPVILPLTNTSLEFTETIGRLYFNKGNHLDIAQKKIQYFIQYINTRYSLQFKTDDADFVSRLAEKSGVPETKIKYLYWKITEIRKNAAITADELMEITKMIDEFYKTAK